MRVKASVIHAAGPALMHVAVCYTNNRLAIWQAACGPSPLTCLTSEFEYRNAFKLNAPKACLYETTVSNRCGTCLNTGHGPCETEAAFGCLKGPSQTPMWRHGLPCSLERYHLNEVYIFCYFFFQYIYAG